MAARQVVAKLADCLEEGKAFDVAYGAADFDQHEISGLVALDDEFLDVVRHMGDHLNGSAEVVATTFLGDDLLIDAAGRDIVLPGGRAPCEPLVMAEIKVGFGTVVGDEDLAMLCRAHGARIDVQIGVELPQADRVSASL